MKKKLVLFVAAMMVSLASHAQFEEGKVYANAGFSGLDLNYNSTSKWNLDLSAKVGYLFMQDWMAVAEGQWGIHQEASNDFSLGAGLRYYIEQNGLYLGVGARYKHTCGYDDFVPNVNLGYAFFLSRTVTVEPELYYDMSTKSFKDYSGFGLRIGFGIYLDSLF
ncbi:MAG: outer membrane beta-barrel protein [Prevotella sp.]|nr:outer membrane beta-barrel protein [Prevotella sp.]